MRSSYHLQNWRRNCRSVICQDIPAQWEGVAVGNGCTAIEPRFKLLGFYPKIQVTCHWKLVLIFKAKLNWESGKQETQYGNQAAILKVASLTLIGFYPYTQVMCYWSLDLIFQARIKFESVKNPIWPPGGHFVSDIAENKEASFYPYTKLMCNLSLDLKLKAKLKLESGNQNI